MIEGKHRSKPVRCDVCGYNRWKLVTRHHLIPKRDGGKLTPTNTSWLCSNCHAEAEAGFLKRETLQQLVFDRLEQAGYNTRVELIRRQEFEERAWTAARESNESDSPEGDSSGQSDSSPDGTGEQAAD